MKMVSALFVNMYSWNGLQFYLLSYNISPQMVASSADVQTLLVWNQSQTLTRPVTAYQQLTKGNFYKHGLIGWIIQDS